MLDTAIQTQLLYKTNQDNIDNIQIGLILLDEEHNVLLNRDNRRTSLAIPYVYLEEDEDMLDVIKRQYSFYQTGEIEEYQYVGYFDCITDKGRSTRQFNFLVRVGELSQYDNSMLIEAYSPDWDNLYQTMSKEAWEVLDRAMLLADI
jgi:hypothetical protein